MGTRRQHFSKRIGLYYLLVALGVTAGCTQASMVNGKSSATYRGMKIFSPTVLSLSDGTCSVPTVDASGIVQPQSTPAPPSSCSTAVMTINGVDIKSLVNVLETAVLAGIAAG